jgi:hypothetical protein
MQRHLRQDGKKRMPAPARLHESVAQSLNTAKKGSLLAALADAMRAAAQVAANHRRRVPLHAQGQIVDGLRRLNGTLAKRPVTMHAAFTTDGPVRFFFDPRSRDGEVVEVFRIVSMSDAGKLERPRVCAYCQSFFFARRDADRFCRNLCRKYWFDKTPAGRKKNAEHQRKHREALQLQRDAQNLRQIQAALRSCPARIIDRKAWVSERCGISKRWLTQAVNRGILTLQPGAQSNGGSR